MTDTEELDLWRTLARARRQILTAYRTGSRAPDKALDEASASALRAAGRTDI